MEPNDDEQDPRLQGPPQGGQDGNREPLLDEDEQNDDDQDDDDEDRIDVEGENPGDDDDDEDQIRPAGRPGPNRRGDRDMLRQWLRG